MNATAPRAADGPALWYPQFFYHMHNRPLEFLPQMKARYGSLVQFRVTPTHSTYLVSDPEMIREILVTQADNFGKGPGLANVKPLLGNGLLTSEGEFHRLQRQLMQPVFHRQRVEAFGATMLESAGRVSLSWQDGQQILALEQMHELALDIVGRTLFDTDVLEEARRVSVALGQSRRMLSDTMLPVIGWAHRIMPGFRRRFRHSRDELDQIIFRLIQEHRQQPRADLLSMLIEAGDRMSDAQIRDEALTLFLAGHETTATCLAFCLYLLASHPSLQEQVAAGLPAGPIQARELPELERVVLESLRLYPPAWVVARMARADFQLGGGRVPQGSVVITSPYVVQRDERWYPMPERFDPDRWQRRPRSQLPRYAFFPFGGGPRVCIGEHFSMMEMVLVLGTLLRDWRLELVSDQHPGLDVGLTLRPGHEIPLKVSRRSVRV